MSLNFAAISPHPPIVVPGIGGGEDLEKAGETIRAMKKMAHAFQEAEIETLIIISPHMLAYPDKFSICGMKKLFGTFASFGAADIMMEFMCDLELARNIDEDSNAERIKTLLYNNDGEFFELDHGLMVPLYYLSKQQETPFKVVPIAYSNLNRTAHFSFGQIIGEIIKKYPSRIGVIASGDLSHRLHHGQKEDLLAGKAFDKKITQDIEANNTEDIMYYDEDFVEAAGECGYRSIIILLGILDGLNIKPKVLSYEGPFGVGYLVACYKLTE